VFEHKIYHLYQYSDINGPMEMSAAGVPAVTAFVLRQLRALGDEADSIGRMASERHGDAALCEAVERLRHRLAAHVLVEERLLVAPLRSCREYHDLLALEDEHAALEHRAAEIRDEGCPAAAVADLSRDLHAHIENEDRIVRTASAAARERLSRIAPWRADELFECAGGPTETWPGEWLG
jgi:hypothetical protein